MLAQYDLEFKSGIGPSDQPPRVPEQIVMKRPSANAEQHEAQAPRKQPALRKSPALVPALREVAALLPVVPATAAPSPVVPAALVQTGGASASSACRPLAEPPVAKAPATPVPKAPVPVCAPAPVRVPVNIFDDDDMLIPVHTSDSNDSATE